MKTDDPSSYEPSGGDEIVAEPKEKSEGSTSDAAGGDADQDREKENPPPPRKKFTVPSALAWIPQSMTWSKLKPVIRCSLTAWVSLVLMIIGPVSRPLGQVNISVSLVRSDEG